MHNSRSQTTLVADSRTSPAPRRSPLRWAVGFAIAVPLIGLAVRTVYTSSSTSDIPQTTILSVATASVEPVNSYQVSQTYIGEVAPSRESELGFERSGELVWIGVDRGNTVTAGTPVARLDTSNLETQRLRLVAQKAEAIAQLQELQTGPRQEKIAAAGATVEDLQQQLELEQIKRDRREYLYAQGAIAKEQLDEVAFNANALAERLQSARSNLNELSNGTRPEQIAAQQAVVRQLEASIADVDVTIAKSTLKAPFAGTISARYFDEGTVAEAGQPVMGLVENVSPEVEIGVPVAVASQLEAGSQQQITIGQQKYPAQVLSILPKVDPATRTRTVVLSLASAQAISPGEIARLEIAQTIPTNGYWLPLTALVEGERGLWSCYVVATENADGNAPVEKRDVELLHTQSSRALVRGMIQEGDRVIVDGTQRIVPTQLVRPL